MTTEFRIRPRHFLAPLIGLLMLLTPHAPAQKPPADNRILLEPQQGTMLVIVTVPALDHARFNLLLPKTIGARALEMVNDRQADFRWTGPGEDGSVTCQWSPGVLVNYAISLHPAVDHIDMYFSLDNLTDLTWEDAWFFTLLSPREAPPFVDVESQRVFFQVGGLPMVVGEADWRPAPRPEITFFLHARMPAHEEPRFLRAMGQTSTTRPDGDWMIGLSDGCGMWFGLQCPDPVFLFRNKEISSIHVAPGFGDIGPGERSVVMARAWFAKGGLQEALARMESARADLAAGTKRARPESLSGGEKKVEAAAEAMHDD